MAQEFPPVLVIDLILHCPVCHVRHIDEGEWEGRPHKTHECQSCGLQWRPSHYYTRGVQKLGEPPK